MFSLLLHVYLCSAYQQAQTKTSYSLFKSWNNNIFGYKLRTIEAENP